MDLRYIFSMVWIRYSSICGFNLSLLSLFLGSICIGLTIGWQENFLIHHVISSSTNGVCFNVDKFKSTIRLVINLGACLGALIPPCLVHIFGHRHDFAIAAILDVIYWISMTLVINSPMALFGTAIGGLAAGSFLVTAIMYVGEVSPAMSHDTVVTLVAFFVYIGILFSTTISIFVYSRIAPVTMSVITLGFLILIYHWMIESPYYLYERGETLKAKVALKNLRGALNILEIDSEYKSMELFFNLKSKSPHTSTNIMSAVFMVNSRKLRENLTLLLLIVSQTIGSYAMDDYIEKYLHKLSQYYEKIIFSLFDILSIGLCIYFLKKIGQRYLIIISICSSSVSYLILAIYSLIRETKYLEMSDYFDKIFTFIILILYCIAYFLAWTPIPPLLTDKIFSNRIKINVVGISISLLYFFAMINQSVFELLYAHKGTYIASIAFTLIGSFGLFLLFMLLFKESTTHNNVKNEINSLTIYAI